MPPFITGIGIAKMRNKNKDIVIRNVVRVSLLLILAALIYRIYSQVTELASDPGSRALQDHNDASKRISSQQASGIIPSGTLLKYHAWSLAWCSIHSFPHA